MKKEKKMIWLLTGIAAVSLLVLCTVVIVRTATYPFIRTTGPDGPPRPSNGWPAESGFRP